MAAALPLPPSLALCESERELSTTAFGSASLPDPDRVSEASLMTPTSTASDMDTEPEDDIVIVFDWDECLFPTQSLCRSSTEPRCARETWSESQKVLVDQVEATALKLVQAAKRAGKMVVITNSQQGWVETSCRGTMPRLWEELKDVTIYSARTQHQTPEQVSFITQALSQPQHPFVVPSDWQLEWKKQAFRHHVHPKVRKLVAFGDAQHDRGAALSLRALYPGLSVSNVLTVRMPTLERYTFQWQTLLTELPSLLCTLETHDVMVNMSS